MKQRTFWNFGDRVKHIREKSGYSQDYVASELGISQRAYSKIETNETQIKGEVLIKLAEIFKTDILELIPQDAVLTYNNVHSFENGNGVVYNTPEKLEDLYKKLLEAKDQQIESLKKLLN
jgi:transcriptional regulator with XRE-family HTH domain